MEILSVLGLVLLSLVIVASLTAWAVALVVQNEIRSFVQARELREVELEARGGPLKGFEADLAALPVNQWYESLQSFRPAANDLGWSKKALLRSSSGRRCKFCEKIKNAIFRKKASPLARDVSAATSQNPGPGTEIGI